MDCLQVRDLLPDYSVEILSGRQEALVKAHLHDCADCRAELRALESVGDLVAEFGVRTPPAGLFNAVRNQIETGRVVREQPAWWSFLYSRPARAAAMGMAMASVALGLFLPVGESAIAPPIDVHPGNGPGVANTALAQSIRQHALSASEGPLTDRVAWEALAQLVRQEEVETRGDRKLDRERGVPGVQ